MKYQKVIVNRNCPHRSKSEWCEKPDDEIHNGHLCLQDKPECFGGEPKEIQVKKPKKKR